MDFHMPSSTSADRRPEELRPARTLAAPARRPGLLTLGALAVLAATPWSAAAATIVVRPNADASVSEGRPNTAFGTRRWLRIAGDTRWRTLMRFDVSELDGPVQSAQIVLRGRQITWTPRLRVRLLERPWREKRVTARRAGHLKILGLAAATQRNGTRTQRIVVDVTRAIAHDGTVTFVLSTPNKRGLEFASREVAARSPLLVIHTAAAPRIGPLTNPAPGSGSGSGAGVGRPGGSSTSGGPGAASLTPALAPPRPVAGVWTTPQELASKPTSGRAWDEVVRAAALAGGVPKLSNQDTDQDVYALAAALVFARTGAIAYGDKARSSIAAAIGTERGGRTLALGRNLPSIVIAADVMNLPAFDPALDGRFRSWLSSVRSETLTSETLISTHEQRANNWGTMAGAARVAADAYLGDAADLNRAAAVFRGWLGDRHAYTGFRYGDLSYQANPAAPVGINPVGATKQGVSIDGALPEEMRRGCSFRPDPCHTPYPWEAMQGAVVQANLLARRGYDAWTWSDHALLRAATYLQGLDALYGGWYAADDDTWQPWLLNYAYGTSLPALSPSTPGKNMGWTDWTLG
jgi:Alginate lyase